MDDDLMGGVVGPHHQSSLHPNHHQVTMNGSMTMMVVGSGGLAN
jgi:hypothetical protein